jgi:hypothetical protein
MSQRSRREGLGDDGAVGEGEEDQTPTRCPSRGSNPALHREGGAGKKEGGLERRKARRVGDGIGGMDMGHRLGRHGGDTRSGARFHTLFAHSTATGLPAPTELDWRTRYWLESSFCSKVFHTRTKTVLLVPARRGCD